MSNEIKIEGLLTKPEILDAEECRIMAEAGYSADDIDDARVIARKNDGSAFYRIGGCGNEYAVEGSTGDVIAELDWGEAITEWGCEEDDAE